MKKIILGLLLVPAVAMAEWPNVGDQVVYVGSIIKDNQRYQATQTETVKEKNNGLIALEQKLQRGDTLEFSKLNLMTIDQAIPAELGAKIVENCEYMNVGGTIETVTVPYGTFKTCRLTKETNESVKTVNIGAVPFGYVQFSFESKTKPYSVSLQLMSVN